MAVIGVWGLDAGAAVSLVGEEDELVVVAGAMDRLPSRLDGCLVAAATAVAGAASIGAHKRAVAPVFFPVLAVVEPGGEAEDLARVLETADDILRLPALPVEGAGRMRCLLASRDRSLAARDRAACERDLRLRLLGLADGIAGEIDAPVQFLGGNLEFLGTAFARVMTMLDSLTEAAMAGDGAEGPEGADALRLVGSLAGLLGDEEFRFALEEVPEAIRESREGLDRVAGLVAAVKRVSGADADVPGPVDVSLAVEDVVRLTRCDWKYVATLAMDVEPELPPVWLPAGVLRLGLLVVVSRAARLLREHIPQDGELGDIAVRAVRHGDRAVVVVETVGPQAALDSPVAGLEPTVVSLLERHGACFSLLEPSGRDGVVDTVVVSLPFRSRPGLGGEAF